MRLNWVAVSAKAEEEDTRSESEHFVGEMKLASHVEIRELQALRRSRDPTSATLVEFTGDHHECSALDFKS